MRRIEASSGSLLSRNLGQQAHQSSFSYEDGTLSQILELKLPWNIGKFSGKIAKVAFFFVAFFA
ncbi:hypothetical protein [Pseudomonas fluorescens]|uniref:hypothetical protein n=1 Tax=Pseudomonas fluorescens TaxID=294 RepID=UPI001CD5371A|nr:hypothetical protein [Pseudomonas fluorescens]